MKICIIGTGYVGLTTGTCLAYIGNNVICVDKDHEKISNLQAGKIPIFEKGLSDLISKSAHEGRISFSTDLKKGVIDSDVIFIAVWTPQKDNGEADISAVKEVAHEIGRILRSNDGGKNHRIIVIKSTVPVGTTENVQGILNSELKGKIKFDIVFNPEFLREGSAVHDTLYPDRIIIGTDNQFAADVMQEIYAPIINQTFPSELDPCLAGRQARPTFYVPFLVTDIKSAEMIKYASNAFLATKISFINEIAHLCELVGADVTKITEGMGLDKRIGPRFLEAGLGYGGSCFPKDTKALDQIAGNHGHDFELLRSVIKVNTAQRQRFIEKIEKVLGTIKGKTIGILGLSFKPNTDDMREAPSIDIINWLIGEGAKIKAYDPAALDRAKAIFGSKMIAYCKDAYEVANGSDALIIATEWAEFRDLDLEQIRAVMAAPVIFDGRNIYDKDKIQKLGFSYISIGRGK